MQKSIRYIVLFLVVLTAGFCTSLQFDAVQAWGKAKVSSFILQETGCMITTGSLRGAPPFSLGVDNIELTHPDIGLIKIASLDVIPSWFEMMFGRISFLWITASGVDLTETRLKSSSQASPLSKELLPPMPFAIHSLHLADCKLPKTYYEPLLNTYSDQSEVDCLISLSGKLYWNPRKEKFSTNLSITPHAGGISPLTVDAQLVATKDSTTLTTTIDALKVSDGSVFFSLPCDRLSIEGAFQAKTEDLLQAFTNKSSTHTTPLVTGTWSVNGIHREKAHIGLNPVLRFSAGGSLQANNHENFSFSTTELSCQKIEPIQSYTQSKKERVQQELLLANADDPQDASTLSRITNIPTPRSIEGSLKRQDDAILGTVVASSLILGDHTIPSCTVSLSSTAVESGWQGSIKAVIALLHDNKEIPVTLSTDFISTTAFDWQLPNVSVSAAGHILAGNLQVCLFPFVVRGTVESSKDTAHELAALCSTTLNKLHCKAAFDANDLNQKMDLTVAIQDLSYSTMSCKAANLAISSTGFFSSPTITTTFTASEIENQSLSIDRVQFNSQMNPADTQTGHPYALHISGESTYGPCKLDCAGTFSEHYFGIHTFEAKSAGHTIKNGTPLHITNDKDGLVALPFEFISDKNMRVQGDALLSNNRLKATLTYSNLPLECFEPFLGDITLFGNISGHLDLSGKKSDPQLALTVATSALSLWNPNKCKAPPLTASCEATLANGILHVSSEVEGLSLKTPTIFELTVPVEITNSTIRFSDSQKLSGHLLAEFDSNTILSSYLDEDELMEGLIQIDARVAGIASDPIVTGTFTWNDGKLFIPILGTLFNQVAMSGQLEDNTLVIQQLSANDGSGGTFTATGWVKNLISRKMNYQLDGKALEFATIALDDATATATGTITITGDTTKTDFAGVFDVHDAAFLLRPTLSKEIPKLDITYVGPQNEVTSPQKTSHAFGLDLELNLSKGFVRGMGLESTWTGNAHVKGKNKAIDVEGKIKLNAGTLDFAGKAFALSQGSLEFNGDLYKKSKLHVLAANDVGQISTQIMLQGPLESPRIVIQSNPAMSQKEILSLLLFNKNSSDISPMQGIQLGQTLLKFKGTNGSLDVIEEIKQRLHIDRLDFGPSQSAGPQMNSPGAVTEGTTNGPSMQDSIPNEVSVQVGKYISDGVIVTLSKDVTNEVNRVGVEANLTQHITAQANVGDDAQTELSLEWKLRY